MLKVKRLSQLAKVPTVANPGEDLGFDLYALDNITLEPGSVQKVRTGIVAWFDPEKYGLLIRDRSSMAAKGITVSGGVIDAGYRGEIIVLLTLEANTELMFEGEAERYVKGYEIKAGDKIAQMIPIHVLTFDPIVEAETVPMTARMAAGFGSTGK
jgi:dUTP pyrophosphatase